MDDHIIQRLKNTRFSNWLDSAQLEYIFSQSRMLTFKKDELIFCQGSKAPAFFLIMKGWVSIIKENENAEQSTLHVFKEGDSFAEPAALAIGHYPASAYAASASELLEIKASLLRKMIQDDPDIAMHMISRLSSQLNTLVNEFAQYKTITVPKRLALFLLKLIEQNPEQNHIDLPFKKTVLAAYLNIQPGTLSRAFNQLEKYGIKTDRRGHIVLDNIQDLKAYINT